MYKDKTPVKNLNKGYGYESSGQEKKNLMNDNPIASRASGGSFMSKHSHSSPSPLSMYGGKKGDDSKSKKDYE